MSSCPGSFEDFLRDASDFIGCVNKKPWCPRPLEDVVRETSQFLYRKPWCPRRLEDVVCETSQLLYCDRKKREPWCPPWFSQLVVWVPLVIILLTVASALAFSSVWSLVKPGTCDCPPEDAALLSLNAPGLEPYPALTPNVNTPLIFSPSQPVPANFSTTTNSTKFSPNAIPPLLGYTPQFTAANGMRVKISGTASASVAWTNTGATNATMYCGLAWDAGSGPHIISEVLNHSTITTLPPLLWATIPFVVTFTPAQVPTGSVVFYLYVRSPDVGIQFEPLSISIQATEDQ